MNAFDYDAYQDVEPRTNETEPDFFPDGPGEKLAETQSFLWREQEKNHVLLEALKLALVVIRQTNAVPANSDTQRYLDAAVVRGEATL